MDAVNRPKPKTRSPRHRRYFSESLLEELERREKDDWDFDAGERDEIVRQIRDGRIGLSDPAVF